MFRAKAPPLSGAFVVWGNRDADCGISTLVTGSVATHRPASPSRLLRSAPDDSVMAMQ